MMKTKTNAELMALAKQCVAAHQAADFIMIAKELYSRGVSLEDLKKLA
jgi:hypothetical protein